MGLRVMNCLFFFSNAKEPPGTEVFYQFSVALDCKPGGIVGRRYTELILDVSDLWCGHTAK